MSERILVFGSRSWSDSGAIHSRLARFPRHTSVITGCAKGADHLARMVALAYSFWVIDCPALEVHWQEYGKGAGHMRNDLMLTLNPTQAIAFWDGRSPGTRRMIGKCQRAGLPWEIVTPHGPVNPLPVTA